MDSNAIKQLIEEQLEEMGILEKTGKISVLDTKWGYVVEFTIVDNKNREFNLLLDKKGKIIYPCNNFDRKKICQFNCLSEGGSIYYTKILKKKDMYGKENEVKMKGEVMYKELDENHFIIPSMENDKDSNLLFFVDEDNKVVYETKIPGRIYANENLMQQKKLLLEETINVTKEEYNMFLYSWKKKCIISDKWSAVFPMEESREVQSFLFNKLHMDKDFATATIKNMQDYNAFLVFLRINSSDYSRHLDFISLIGTDGIPVFDLMNISANIYKIRGYQLRRDRIGEIEEKRKMIKELLDEKIKEQKEEKKNYIQNFYQGGRLEVRHTKQLGEPTGEDDWELK